MQTKEEIKQEWRFAMMIFVVSFTLGTLIASFFWGCKYGELFHRYHKLRIGVEWYLNHR